MSWLPLLKIIAAGSFLLEGTEELQLLKRLGEENEQRKKAVKKLEERDQGGRMGKLPVGGWEIQQKELDRD